MKRYYVFSTVTKFVSLAETEAEAVTELAAYGFSPVDFTLDDVLDEDQMFAKVKVLLEGVSRGPTV